MFMHSMLGENSCGFGLNMRDLILTSWAGTKQKFVSPTGVGGWG